MVFGLLVLAVVAAAGLAVAHIRLRPLGRRLLAIRANERAATAAGVDVGTTKVAAFVVSAFLAGAAGALLGYQQGQLSYSSFGVFVSLSFLAVASWAASPVAGRSSEERSSQVGSSSPCSTTWPVWGATSSS